MSQDIEDTNTDFSGLVAAAQAKASAETVDVVSEAAAFVTGLGRGSGGYVQPGAADVSDSLSGVTDTPVDPAMAMDMVMPMDMADCPPGMGM